MSSPGEILDADEDADAGEPFADGEDPGELDADEGVGESLAKGGETGELDADEGVGEPLDAEDAGIYCAAAAAAEAGCSIPYAPGGIYCAPGGIYCAAGAVWYGAIGAACRMPYAPGGIYRGTYAAVAVAVAVAVPALGSNGAALADKASLFFGALRDSMTLPRHSIFARIRCSKGTTDRNWNVTTTRTALEPLRWAVEAPVEV